MPLKGGIFTVQKLSQNKADFKQCKLQGTFHWSFSFSGCRVLAPMGLEICEVCWLQAPAVSPREPRLALGNRNIQVQSSSFPLPGKVLLDKAGLAVEIFQPFFAQALLSLFNQHAVNSWKPVSHFDHIRWLCIFLF